jgi:hypothetical protein
VSEGWHSAYLAVSVALGDPVDDALASLGAPLDAGGATLADALRSPSREVRVRALARAAAGVAMAVDALGLP